MENASKALMMAGAVLIAVGVITLSLYVYSVFSNYANTMEIIYSTSQVESFNRFYESFPEGVGLIRGVDAVNLYWKAIDDEIGVSMGGIDYANLDVTEYLSSYSYSITARDGSGRVSRISLSKNSP